MLVYRIASEEYIRDLSGYGVKLYGGRWNRAGVAVLYAGCSLSLCAWEYWVHLPDTINFRQNAFATATILLLDSSPLVVQQHDINAHSNSFYTLTDNWLEQGEHLVMQVPSVVIAGEYNYLVNPQHPLFAEVRLQAVSPFSFDQRAFGKSLSTYIQRKYLSSTRCGNGGAKTAYVSIQSTPANTPRTRTAVYVKQTSRICT